MDVFDLIAGSEYSSLTIVLMGAWIITLIALVIYLLYRTSRLAQQIEILKRSVERLEKKSHDR